MATRTHPMVVYALETEIGSITADTALDGTGRHDFTSKTIYLPESSKVFKSVHVEITFRTATATNATLNGWRIGAKLGAGAFDDTDYTPSAITASGESYLVTVTRDLTAYFQANWSGSSMAFQAALEVDMSTGITITGLTCKLVIGAYTYDDASSATRVKTVAIPIQSEHQSLTTSASEIGTGGVNGVSSGQIPALDSFLPEASVTIRESFLEIVCNEGLQADASSTTDFAMDVEIDGGGTSTRYTVEAGLSSRCEYRDLVNYDTSTYSTASTHTLELLSSVTDRFSCPGAILWVTYEYDASTTTTVLNSLILPIGMQEAGSEIGLSTDPDRFQIELWAVEPSVSLVQSGLLLIIGADNAGQNVVVAAGSQTGRTYEFDAVSIDGPCPFVHRVDHGSGWSLSRGKNTLQFSIYTASSPGMGMLAGMAIINYTSGVAANGIAAHNGTTVWHVVDIPTTGSVQQVLTQPAASIRTPEIGADYFINSYGHCRDGFWGNPSITTRQTPWGAFEVQSGELTGGGWRGYQRRNLQNSEQQNRPMTIDLLPWFNRDSNASGKMDVETARDFRFGGVANGPVYTWAVHYLTHHENTFSAADAITDYGGTGSGETVYIFDLTDGCVVATATTGSGGSYSATLFDDTHQYFPFCQEDATHVGAGRISVPT